MIISINIRNESLYCLDTRTIRTVSIVNSINLMPGVHMNMKLTIRCGNDGIRVGDINQAFRICSLIETAMGIQKEGAEKETSDED